MENHTIHQEEEEEEEQFDDVRLLDATSDNLAADKQEKQGQGQAVTPLPLLSLVVLSSILLCDALSVTFLFPFVVFMVRGYDGVQDEQVGMLSGLLASSFAVSQLLSAFPWGRLSDRIGRRRTLLSGLLGNMVAILLFGLSNSYATALLTRCLGGLANGNVGIAKAYLSDILDHTNMNAGFSILGLMWGVGNVLGPVIGGVLYGVGTDAGFSPHMVACFVICAVQVVGFVVGLFVLKEPRRETTAEEEAAEMEEAESRSQESGLQQALRLLKDPGVRASAVCYAMIALIYITYDESMPLLFSMDKKRWGLGMSSTDIGITFAISGALILATQIFIFPRVADRLGVRKTFIVSQVTGTLYFLTFPLVSLLKDASDWVLWLFLVFMIFNRSWISVFAFTSSFVLVNQSAPADQRGAANGLAQSLGSGARAVGPFLGGSIFGASTNAGLGLFGVFVLYIILVVFSMGNSWLAITGLVDRPVSETKAAANVEMKSLEDKKV